MHYHHKKPTKPTSKFFLIAMSSLFLLSLLSLLIFSALPSSAIRNHHNHRHDGKASATSATSIQQACKAARTLNTQLCETSLIQSKQVPPDPTAAQIIQASIWVTTQNLVKAQSMVQTILDSSGSNLNRSNAAQNCVEYLKTSDYRIKSAVEALPRGKTKDARAWLSAAEAYQYDCWSALKYVNDSQLINQTMSFMDTLIKLSSNSLSMTMAYDVFGSQTGSWVPPRTERDGFWENPSGSDLASGKIGLPGDLKPDVTVCKGGACDYSTVQEAVNAGPSNGKRFVVLIKEGVYDETVRVPLEKKNVVFLGDGMGKTVITGSRNVGQPGVSTYNSATVGVKGDGFMASGLTIQNTAGPDAHQAVAFVSDSDLSVIENCEFLGNQDTLYAHSLRQFYKSCHIEGNVDFIFGNSASVFQDCTILIRPRQLKPEKGSTNAVTAHGRIDPAQSAGFVFHNCLINGTEEYMQYYNSNPKVYKNFLGRPWKEFSRTVFIDCVLEALITPQGWMPWTGDFALKTLYYGEFNSSGAGANVSARVPWSNQIPANHVGSYSVQNFIQGNEWIPTSS
ncbi:hypothetical protein DCAR_0101291 [Daucus carota subsp. sativus]|uniref:pectinesterase n=1 Tax=Daucus carota subsp. sativus TaxID=79200 RepID=A0AAF0W2Z6_DAUCS|nr:PREDICTED: probable pectinesterase/pectinesterase inhibitor 51 [Daucus carota subsp. sativus]WOG82129.1 hypothetical protein DCAR_0101291 [Daucus carota subsp. sativus]